MPTLALIEADGKKVAARITRFSPGKMQKSLAKVAKKAEAKAARAAKKNRKKK